MNKERVENKSKKNQQQFTNSRHMFIGLINQILIFIIHEYS